MPFLGSHSDHRPGLQDAQHRREKDNLMIFIRPKILRDAAQAAFETDLEVQLHARSAAKLEHARDPAAAAGRAPSRGCRPCPRSRQPARRRFARRAGAGSAASVLRRTLRSARRAAAATANAAAAASGTAAGAAAATAEPSRPPTRRRHRRHPQDGGRDERRTRRPRRSAGSGERHPLSCRRSGGSPSRSRSVTAYS